MPQAFNGRIVNYVCTIHALNYGRVKEPPGKPPFSHGFCDICEVTGQPNVIQSVTSPRYYQGLVGDEIAYAKKPTP